MKLGRVPATMAIFTFYSATRVVEASYGSEASRSMDYGVSFIGYEI